MESPGADFTRTSSKTLSIDAARKRRVTLFRKTNEFCAFTGADAYLLLYYRGRFYSYSSKELDSWPPSKDQLVGSVALATRLHYQHMS